MTVEELQAALDKSTAALEKANTSITKLEAKNEEIIGKLKAADARADEAEEKATGPTSDLEKMTKRAERAEKAAQDAADREVQANKTLRAYKADSAIAQSLAANNVDSKHSALLTKALKADIEYDDAGNPSIEGKAVDAYLKNYFAKDGLSYVRAAENSGSGSTGGTQTQTPRMTKDNINYSEFGKLAQENPAEANALADAMGRPDLRVN